MNPQRLYASISWQLLLAPPSKKKEKNMMRQSTKLPLPIILVLTGSCSAIKPAPILELPQAALVPSSLELCPKGEGTSKRIENSKYLLIDEQKATCYANQLEYLDQRPEEEQRKLNRLFWSCAEHCDLEKQELKNRFERTHMRKVWAYTLVAGLAIASFFVGRGTH
jgi:hypothetical protein